VHNQTHLVLPFPPSINGYWRAWNGRQIISKRGREYRQAVADIIDATDQPAEFGGQTVMVSIALMVPDRRKRDVDNYAKAILDALTHAGVWDDDYQVQALNIVRIENHDTKGGAAVVSIIPAHQEAMA